MSKQGAIGVQPIPGREDEARKIMAALGYEPAGATQWFIPFVGMTYPAARERLIERLNKHDWDWSESLTVSDLPDHPDA